MSGGLVTDPVGEGARRAAERLAGELDPRLVFEVEAELHARGMVRRSAQYIDPVSLASLVVSVASFAWTVYRDLRKRSPDPTPPPAPDVVERQVRVDLHLTDDLLPEQRDRIIRVVVEETIRAAAAGQG